MRRGGGLRLEIRGKGERGMKCAKCGFPGMQVYSERGGWREVCGAAQAAEPPTRPDRGAGRGRGRGLRYVEGE